MAQPRTPGGSPNPPQPVDIHTAILHVQRVVPRVFPIGNPEVVLCIENHVPRDQILVNENIRLWFQDAIRKGLEAIWATVCEPPIDISSQDGRRDVIDWTIDGAEPRGTDAARIDAAS